MRSSSDGTNVGDLTASLISQYLLSSFLIPSCSCVYTPSSVTKKVRDESIETQGQQKHQ